MREVHSVTDFLTAVRTAAPRSSHGSLAVYRGQKDAAWPLLPGIARHPFNGPDALCRDYKDSNDKSAERRLLVVIADYGAAHFPTWVWHGSPEEVRWKQLIVAQHHGLPTRLLDWTTNALSALYFAVEGDPVVCREPTCPHCTSPSGAHPSRVHALLERDSFSVSSLARYNDKPPCYTIDRRVGLIRPPEIDGRISAQDSLFSISSDPLTPIAADLTLDIPAPSRERLLKELDEIGINRKALFPDLDGVAQYLKWSVRYWHHDPGVVRP